MTDPWEPTATDREAYHRGVGRRRGDAEWRSDALLDAGLREAFASLRARVGEPVTAELISTADRQAEYRQTAIWDDVMQWAGLGWQLVGPPVYDPYAAATNGAAHGLIYVLQRPADEASADDS